MSSKRRLDQAVFELGLAKSRSAAQALVMAGDVLVNGQVQHKSSVQVLDSDTVEIREKLKYVSRGGLKLEKALDVFPLELEGRVCIDVGASTGGFTHCMLLNGARKVYAVDVGYGQLDYALRNDERVVCMERVNARYLESADFADVTFASIDVSFISLRLILPALFNCLQAGADVVALIKPQFEAGKEHVGKHGVVRDANVHAEVIQSVIEYALETGFSTMMLDYSPITGPKGNIEFLLWLKKQNDSENKIPPGRISECVQTAAEAHR